MPLVSVLTTAKDCSQFLPASLDSIVNQSFTDFEVILINDGSTDNTTRILREFKASQPTGKVKLVEHASNRCIPFSRNEGIRLARGKYIVIHDGDDVSLPIRFISQAAFLERHTDVFCVGGHAVKIDHDGNQVSIMDYPPEHSDQIIDMLMEPKRNPMIDPTVMYRRTEFIQLGGYSTDTSIYTVPDFDLWCRATVKGMKMANLQYPVIHYRVNPNGMTQRHHKEMMRAHGRVHARFLQQMKGFK